jgi:hypothetical protein
MREKNRGEEKTRGEGRGPKEKKEKKKRENGLKTERKKEEKKKRGGRGRRRSNSAGHRSPSTATTAAPHRTAAALGNLMLPCFVSSCSAPACICMQNVNNSRFAANGEGAGYCVGAQ